MKTRGTWWLLLVFAMVAACGGGDGRGEGEGATPEDAGADAEDAGAADTGLPPQTDTSPDVTVEDVAPGLTAEELYCRPCESVADCDPGNYCLGGYPGDGLYCSANCLNRPEICPEGTSCVRLDAVGAQQACVPDNALECACRDVECEEGLLCDPNLNGECVPPLDLCEPCVSNEQCGEGNYCLTYRLTGGATENACATDCSASACPEGYECGNVNIGDDAVARLCIPELRTCVDRCVDVECEEGLRCNPLNGDCEEPAGICDRCSSNAECGGEDDLCLSLQTGPCDRDSDCAITEVCNEGNCVSNRCGQVCDPDAGTLDQCPPDTACFRINAGADGPPGQCLPIRLTCINKCNDVDCPEGFGCDDATGGCVPLTAGYCNDTCTSNGECGTYDDLCLNIGTGGARCLQSCRPDDLEYPPCAQGYDCVQTFNQTFFCLPQNFDFDCEDCVDTACPETDVCMPVDASCQPFPAPTCALDDPATEVREDACPDGFLCNPSETRCEPIGLPCASETWFLNCYTGEMGCTAVNESAPGSCEESCFSDTQCPQERPYCESYQGVFSSVCVADERVGPSGCGRLVPNGASFGRPCEVVDDPTDPALCPTANAELCLVTDPNVPGFCTRTCETDADCGSNTTCGDVDGTRYCLPSVCDCLATIPLADGEVDQLDALFAASGQSRCSVGLSLEERRAGYGVLGVDDPYRVRKVAGLEADPLSASGYFADAVAAVAGAASVRARAATALRSALAEDDISPRPVAPPTLVGPEATLASQLGILAIAMGGDRPEEGSLDALSALPSEVEAALALYVARLTQAVGPDGQMVDLRGEVLDIGLAEALDLIAGEGASFDDAATLALLGPGVRDVVFERSMPLVEGLAELPPLAVDAPTLRVEIDTPRGLIVIAGSGDDVHAFEASPLLLIDLGGDDTYTGPIAANAGAEQPFSVVIDAGGADDYGYVTVPDENDAGLLPSDAAGRGEFEVLDDGPTSLSLTSRQGAGTYGAGILLDLGPGADTFRSLRASQGFGFCGVGVLIDEGGTATFEAEAYSQGAGLFGVGVLATDDAGSTSRAWHASQGFAGPAGFGIRLSGRGVDAHTMEEGAGDPLYFNRLTSTFANLSYGLGAGVGVRAEDTADDRGAGGGLALFVDLDGDDTYATGIGSLGFGEWHGGGFFYDAGGSDIYRTAGASLGVGFAMGVGVFDEGAGDDIYGDATSLADNARRSAGFADDFGVGILIDRGGDDQHRHSAFSYGYGQLNGFALFAELSGDDTYETEANSTWGVAALTILGSSPNSNPRRAVPTFGWFIDAAGADTYARPDLLSPPIADFGAWQQTSRDEDDLPVYAGGIDGIGATGL